jgi:hypothetical protein
MFQFQKLPIDLLLLVRSYLVVLYLVEEDVDEIQNFIRQESERSWRNLLSTSGSEAWKTIRKETMVWSLNSFAFRKYLQNEDFRQYTHERMTCRVRQLNICNRYSFAFPNHLPLNSILLSMISTSNISCIYIFDYIYETFPSSTSLRTLGLIGCQHLGTIGDFPHLQKLHLGDCPLLQWAGKMASLLDLHFSASEDQQFPLESILSQFSLEYLQILKIDRMTDALPRLSHRLHRLQALSIFTEKNLSFSGQLFPNLVKLHLSYFSSIDLVGLNHLTELTIVETPSGQIFGKKEIYPQLKAFNYSSWTDLGESLAFYHENLKNVSDLSLFLPFNVSTTFNITIKIENLDLFTHKAALELLVPERFFKKIKINYCDFSVGSVFSRVQILHLALPQKHLVDLTPFHQIPYLHLEDLPPRANFSCLGAQRYLKICRCYGLTDADIARFGNIFRLSIEDCHKITHVVRLKNNRYLDIFCCNRIITIELPGKDFLRVSIKGCCELRNLNITGKVYSLEVVGNDLWKEELPAGTCKYFNGEEIVS